MCRTIDDIQKEHYLFVDPSELDDGTLDQFKDAMAMDFVVRGALMADAHKGYTLPIGGVVATEGVVVPAYVGYDIGCGVCAHKLPVKADQVRSVADKIFNDIYRAIPTGFAHNQKKSEWIEESSLERSDVLKNIFDKNGLKQLCSLGGGNHFIELAEDEDQNVWITIHSGSRGVGHAVATHYMKAASGTKHAREGNFPLRTDSDEGREYIIDLNFCLAFALENRKQMIGRIIDLIAHRIDYDKSAPQEFINRNHNHAEFNGTLWIHRKGATHAEKDMMGVIPGNMRDGSFIVRGLGNPKSMSSSSHGAGRVLSRKKASESLTMDAFKKSMQGIVARVQPSTLDESPAAYKNIFHVMKNQKELVEMRHHLKPILNVKA